MKQLRVLSGRHAGAQIRLTKPSYRISAHAQADIQIFDWTREPLILSLQADGAIHMTFDTQTTGMAEPSPERLEDFQPRKFGKVVLCAGPFGREWPSDVTLLRRLMRQQLPKKPTPPAIRRHTAAALTGGVLVVAAAGAVFTVASWSKQAPPEPQAAHELLLARVARAVAPLSLNDIVVSPVGSQVVVEGLVNSTADLASLRMALSPFPGGQVMHRYAVAPDIAQSIVDALATPELSVSYQGQGRFRVQGQTLNVDKVRDATTRIAADLAPVVRGIDVAVTRLPAPERVPVNAMLSANGLQYVQTRDGAKHLSLLPHATERPRAPVDFPK